LKTKRIIFFLLALSGLNILLFQFYVRLDLTKEKRFSVNQSTKKLLKNLTDEVKIEVFLTGDLSSDYKKLSIATEELLNEFENISNGNLQVRFVKPGQGLTDTLKYNLYDSLIQMGVVYERNVSKETDNDKSTEQIIFPAALVYYKNYKPLAVDLRSSKKVYKNYNVVNELPQEDIEATRNAAEALLEFKFANAIHKLTRNKIPTIAYLVGNGQPIDLKVNDLGESLRNEYRLAIYNLKEGFPNPAEIDALIIIKPTIPFTDIDKFKIDQYVMHGGNIFWGVDKLYAELDSLMRTQADFVAFDRKLNIEDLLFKYGVRINSNLIQDLNCAKIPVVVGYNPDGKPQMQRIPFPYYPFLSSKGNHPISKNLDKVLPIFPSSIDTIKTENISKTILLATDSNSRALSTPAIVSLNSVKSESDFGLFNQSHIPISVLLEGKYKSLYANRLSKELNDSLVKSYSNTFLNASTKSSKQIILSDADLVMNAVSTTTGPLPMGMLPYENYQFANKEFFLNCIEYLVDNSGILESRNKDFTLRLLDKQKLKDHKTYWQLINILIPVLTVFLFGFIFITIRKRKFN
jgi:ABC-2 type transport system permease protein